MVFYPWVPLSNHFSRYLVIHCGATSLIIHSCVVGTWVVHDIFEIHYRSSLYPKKRTFRPHPTPNASRNLKDFLGCRNWLALLSQFCLTSPYSQGWHSDTVWSSFHLVPCVFIPWHSGITRRRAESVHMNWGTVIPCPHCWSQARAPPLTMLQQ